MGRRELFEDMEEAPTITSHRADVLAMAIQRYAQGVPRGTRGVKLYHMKNYLGGWPDQIEYSIWELRDGGKARVTQMLYEIFLEAEYMEIDHD